MHQTLKLSRENMFQVTPTTCNIVQCESGHAFGPAIRNFYLIHYIFSGQGKFTNSLGEYALSQGQCFIIHPQEVCYYEASKDNPWKYAWFGFICTNPPAQLEQCILNIPSVRPIFDAVNYCASINSSGRELYVTGLIYQLLALMIENDENTTKQTRYEILRIKSHIESNYSRKFSVGEMAESLHLERSYFSKIFKETIGVSPQTFVIQCRLENAAYMLRYKKMKPVLVALAVGYPDEFSFSRAFHKAYGMSPSQYSKIPVG